MLKSTLKSLLLASRILRLRLAGVHIASPRLLASGIDCRLGVGAQGLIELGAGVWIETCAVLHAYGGSIRLGQNVFLGQHAVIFGHGGVEIGEDTLIAMHCSILSSNHTIAPRGTPIRTQPDVLLPTKIGADVWLGANVTVLGGVTIGDGCVVGAGSVVTSNLPANVIAVGLPARVIGERR